MLRHDTKGVRNWRWTKGRMSSVSCSMKQGQKAMTSTKLGKSLVACLLNVSEARNKDNIERIARAALYNSCGQQHPDTAVLNVFSNYDYNRSVLTIVSTSEQIGTSVVSSCVEGFTCIEHSQHEGIHPCLGAIDLVPIYPLSGVTLEQCGKIARGVGASPYVMNCNITLDTQDLTSGKAIATAIRERTGGLKGVQAMAFPNKGQVEIACNVESFRDFPEINSAAGVDKYVSYPICGDTFSYISPRIIEAEVQKLAACKGIKTAGTALVGFTPQECRMTAEYALSHGIHEFWKRRQGVFM
ncbi:formiminotransferase N-terminal subdomain-containing protein isoform X5 [Dendropsophus ebraccatus]|uniref:formiminotransferase N-terminal subdomain-containing protein isoform X5 n=1 Tax=Dendropsophus ebraccatus TaxID=150705 RepID=UPI003832324E